MTENKEINKDKSNVDKQMAQIGEKAFNITLVVILSIIILLILVKVIMDNSKINQGQLRPVDVIVSSTAMLEDTSKTTGQWSFNLSQKNQMDILIQAPQDAIYSINPETEKQLKLQDITNSTLIEAKLTNITVSGSNKENMYIYQKDYEEEEINLKDTNTLVLNTSLSEDKQMLYQLCIVNNIKKDFVIPEGIDEIQYNGKIFTIAGLSISDLQFVISFNLEIKEYGGRINQIRVKLTLPNDNFILDGYVVENMDISNFNFRLK